MQKVASALKNAPQAMFAATSLAVDMETFQFALLLCFYLFTTRIAMRPLQVMTLVNYVTFFQIEQLQVFLSAVSIFKSLERRVPFGAGSLAFGALATASSKLRATLAHLRASDAVVSDGPEHNQ